MTYHMYYQQHWRHTAWCKCYVANACTRVSAEVLKWRGLALGFLFLKNRTSFSSPVAKSGADICLSTIISLPGGYALALRKLIEKAL